MKIVKYFGAYLFMCFIGFNGVYFYYSILPTLKDECVPINSIEYTFYYFGFATLLLTVVTLIASSLFFVIDEILVKLNSDFFSNFTDLIIVLIFVTSCAHIGIGAYCQYQFCGETSPYEFIKQII